MIATVEADPVLDVEVVPVKKKRHRHHWRARRQKVFTVLMDVSPMPAIPADAKFAILDHSTKQFSDLKGTLRKQVYCCYCGTQCQNHGQIDHIIPVCRGGLTTATNLVLACAFCNNQKGSRTAVEYLRTMFAAMRRCRVHWRHIRLSVS